MKVNFNDGCVGWFCVNTVSKLLFFSWWFREKLTYVKAQNFHISTLKILYYFAPQIPVSRNSFKNCEDV